MQRKSRGGSVVLDKRSKVWNFYWWENGKRRSRVIGSRSQFTKTTARLAASLWKPEPQTESITVGRLVELYRVE
jgi:hypothetical protein